ncbi:MAG: potassium channel family protein [Acholeplasmataceae bacterium]
MPLRTKRIILWLLIALLITLVATIGYMLLLDIGLIDALYMTVITISTVGYQEVVEMDPAARLFTIVVIVVSIGLVGYIATMLVRFFSEGIVNEAWRRKKMERQIRDMDGHIIICGAGETGVHVIEQFKQRHKEFVVIENNEEALGFLQEEGIDHVEGDATKEATLLKAGIRKAKGLITTLSTDADNVYVVLTARELNENIQIIARSHEEHARKKLIRAGANNTVSPNEIGGKKLASLLLRPSLSNFMDHVANAKDLALDLAEIEIKESSRLAMKMLKDTRIADETDLVVIALRCKQDDAFLFNPRGEQKLMPGDNMVVIGRIEQIEKLKDLAQGHA